MRLTVEICVVRLCRRTFGRKTFAASIRIRAFILHLAGDSLAASMRITRGIHYKDKLNLERDSREYMSRLGSF